MNSRILRNIETSFGYLDALQDVGILSEDKYLEAHKHLWNLRAIVNVALNDYESDKGKVSLVKTFDD